MSTHAVVIRVPAKMADLHTVIDRMKHNWHVDAGKMSTIERLASLLVGATVVILVAQRFLFYLGLASVGSYLLYRGATGDAVLSTTAQINTRKWHAALPVLERSKGYEQNNSARQMATCAGQPQKRVGPAYG